MTQKIIERDKSRSDLLQTIEPKGIALEFLEDIGISMSAGYLSNLLIKNHADFETEKTEVYSAGLESSPWQHFDQTAARVGGSTIPLMSSVTRYIQST